MLSYVFLDVVGGHAERVWHADAERSGLFRIVGVIPVQDAAEYCEEVPVSSVFLREQRTGMKELG